MHRLISMQYLCQIKVSNSIGARRSTSSRTTFTTETYIPQIIIPNPQNIMPMYGEAIQWQIHVNLSLSTELYWMRLQIWRPTNYDKEYSTLIYTTRKYTEFESSGITGMLVSARGRHHK